MPLIYKPDVNLLRSRAQVLVNNVNCVGVMGKGLARSFAEAYGDDIMRHYTRLCSSKTLRPGDVRFERMSATQRKHAPSREHCVALLATKDHWRDPSRLEWIDLGLSNLHDKMKLHGYDSLAIAPPGCGLGGLAWSDVHPLVEEYLGKFKTEIYAAKPTEN
jgi:O-acetyl-ADP-ribose deacetylase (regulator of RNase III)